MAVNLIFNSCIARSSQNKSKEVGRILENTIDQIIKNFFMKRLYDAHPEIQIAIIDNLVLLNIDIIILDKY